MKWVGVANARTLKCGGIIFPQRGSVHRSVHRSSVFLFFGLRPIRLCAFHTSCRQSLSSSYLWHFKF